MAMIYGNISNCNVVDKGTRSEYQVRLGYEILKENVETNTRDVKLQLEARTINANYTTFGYNQTSTIDGVQLQPATFSIRNVNQWVVFGTRTIVIKGAFNGTKTGSFITNANTTWQLKSGSASVNISLENLHTPAEITSIEIEEKNTLLENATQIVQQLSIKNFTFETITYDDATISSYQVYHNGVLIGSSTTNGMTIDFGNVSSLATFEMNGKLYCTLKFLVIDSFNTSSFVEIQYEVIQYTKPSLVKTSSSIKRNGQLTGKVKLNLVGSFYNNKVNDISNTIKLEFAYWKKGEEESTTYYEIPFEPTNNNINLYSWAVKKDGVEITDIDKDFAYIFKIRATDYFNKVSDIDLLCPVGEYVWAEFKNRVDFKAISIQNEKVLKQSTLYEEESGTTENIILSESAANFSYLEIFFGSSEEGIKSIRVPNPNGKITQLVYDTFDYADSSNIGHIHNVKIVNINESLITKNFARRIYFYPSYTKPLEDDRDNVYIFKVLGYK